MGDQFFCSFFGFFNKATAYTPERIFTQNTSNDVVPGKKVPFRVLDDMADDERSCTSLVVFMLLHTQFLFVSSNKIMYTSINQWITYWTIWITVIITKLQVAPVELDVSSQSSQSSSTRRASRASRARRVERVELCCSTSSTQPKCMGSTRRMCRVESSQVEFEP